MSIGGWVKHKAHKAKHAVEHTAHNAEHTAKHAVGQVSHTTDNAVSAVGYVAKQAENEVNKLVDVGHITEEIKDEILKSINHVKDEAVKTIKTAGEEAARDAKKAIKQVADDAKHELEKDFKELLERFEGQTAHEVLEYLVDVVRTLSPSSVDVQLGPISVSLGDLEKKVEHLIKWAKNPPHNRETWIDFVKDVTPDSLSLSASIGFALIIESSDLEIAISATWDRDDILDNIDDILKKAGI